MKYSCENPLPVFSCFAFIRVNLRSSVAKALRSLRQIHKFERNRRLEVAATSWYWLLPKSHLLNDRR